MSIYVQNEKNEIKFHVDRMKFICILSVKLFSFAVLKALLTQFWQLVFAVSNRQPNFLWYKYDLLRVDSFTENLIWEFSNLPSVFFVYTV